MIIPLTDDNLLAWAKLCIALWPDNKLDEILSMRAQGHLENEFLFIQDEIVVAFISLSLRHDYVEGTESSPVGYIEGLYVLEEFRGQGIARALIRHAKDWTRNKGARELASDVELDNLTSQRFHETVGFQEAGRIVCFTMKV